MKTRASQPAINRHWDVLCHDIGHRTAGSTGEQEAADYIESRLQNLGLTDIQRHHFEFPNWSSSRCMLKVSVPGDPKMIRPPRRITSARANSYSVSTPKKWIRGRLAYLQSGLPLDFDQPLKGKIGLLIGALALSDEKLKQRIMRSGLKALLSVDTRVPFGWPVSQGAAPHWVDGFNVPMAGIAYHDAINLVEQLPSTAELSIQARHFTSASQNILGQIVGHEYPDEVILVSGHHDCVEENVGADDNASGVIFMLELARILSKHRLRRTVRFVSYGVEERLSIGSYLYMRSLSKAQQRKIIFAANADGISSAVGTDHVRVTGTPPLERLVQQTWRTGKHPAQISSSVHAYTDHFPFNIVGVPSVSLGRSAIVGGASWQLHSKHDNTDHVSTKVLARSINTTAKLLLRIANVKTSLFTRRINPILQRQVRSIARDIYRHPWSPKDTATQ